VSRECVLIIAALTISAAAALMAFCWLLVVLVGNDLSLFSSFCLC
jgi:hypothetical protein